MKNQLEIVKKGLGLIIAVVLVVASSQNVFAANSSQEIDREVDAAFQNLLEGNPDAMALSKDAAAVLVFPSIVKGGFIFAGQYGTGALRQADISTAYYKSTAVSYGLQAGAQQFGYALFFMSEEDLSYLEKSKGWEVGGAPSLVLFDEGMAGSFSTTTQKKGIYAFFFNQKGVMAGLGLQGTKITEIYPIN